MALSLSLSLSLSLCVCVEVRGSNVAVAEVIGLHVLRETGTRSKSAVAREKVEKALLQLVSHIWNLHMTRI